MPIFLAVKVFGDISAEFQQKVKMTPRLVPTQSPTDVDEKRRVEFWHWEISQAFYVFIILRGFVWLLCFLFQDRWISKKKFSIILGVASGDFPHFIELTQLLLAAASFRNTKSPDSLSEQHNFSAVDFCPIQHECSSFFQCTSPTSFDASWIVFLRLIHMSRKIQTFLDWTFFNKILY